MELVHAEYDRRLSAFHARDTRPMPLYVFRDPKDYLKFLQARMIDGANSGGMFFSDGNEFGLATFLHGQSRARMYHVLQHEGFHQFAYARIGQELPPWANEGLAEYFGDAYVARGKFITGSANAGRIASVVAAIEKEQTLPLRELLDLPQEEWNSRVRSGAMDAILLYDQSWSVVHFLIHAQNGKYAGPFMDYLQNVVKGFRRTEAFERAFGRNAEQPMEKAWKRYVQQLKPDPAGTAAHRLLFLAEGLKELHERGETAASMDELKAKLQKIDFKLRVIEHNRVVTISASEAENYEPPQPADKGQIPSIRLVPHKKGELPPEIIVEGIRPSVRLRWSREEGEPVSEIVFE